jgi:hypothetical protein
VTGRNFETAALAAAVRSSGGTACADGRKAKMAAQIAKLDKRKLVRVMTRSLA